MPLRETTVGPASSLLLSRAAHTQSPARRNFTGTVTQADNRRPSGPAYTGLRDATLNPEQKAVTAVTAGMDPVLLAYPPIGSHLNKEGSNHGYTK
jgi:hypothetical protein